MAWSVLSLLHCLFLTLIFTSKPGNSENKIQALNEVNNGFAFRLYKAIVSGTRPQNVFFSPPSVSTALAALSLGAGGETRQQILSGLGFNSSVFTSEEMHQAYLTLLKNLNHRTGVDLNVGTAVYVNETFKPHPEFLENLKNLYLSEGFSVDFKNTTKTMNKINKYVEEKTRGKISKFLENLDPQTVMYLLSYVYFKGKWAVPFDPQTTRKDQFHVDKETTVPVQMMFISDDFYTYYDHQLSVRILRLNYNDSFSMILALPNDINILEEALHQHHITKWQKWMSERECRVFLPKLSLKTSYDLSSILPRMGFLDMFSPNANFSGISDENLLVSEAVHKATLDVDEAGATATAVTGIGLVPLSARIVETLKFDRPFMIFIVDHQTKNILFMGKIINPTNSEDQK